MTPPTTRPEEGVGCRSLVIALAALVTFAVIGVALGLWMALGDTPGPVTERIGLLLYATGAPISALFAAVAGELPLAPLTDIVVWIVAAYVSARYADRRRAPLWKPLGVTMASALVWGAVASSFLERV